jgi:hypothetical protein
MLLEETFEGLTRCLPRLVWLPVQQPRTLADEGCELGSFGRISTKGE